MFFFAITYEMHKYILRCGREFSSGGIFLGGKIIHERALLDGELLAGGRDDLQVTSVMSQLNYDSV